MSSLANGGFPPLIIKNINKKQENNKERLIKSTITNNINIREILQIKTNKNILENINKDKNELEIVTSL